MAILLPHVDLLSNKDGRYVCYRQPDDTPLSAPSAPLDVALYLYKHGALHCYQRLFRQGRSLMEVVVHWVPQVGQYGQRQHRPAGAELADPPCLLTEDLAHHLNPNGQLALVQGGRFTGRRGVVVGHDLRMTIVALEARRGYAHHVLSMDADVVRALPAHVYPLGVR